MKKPQTTTALLRKPGPRKFTDGSDRFAIFNKARDNPWWKSHLGQRRMTHKGRYALVVSISAAGQAIDLHTEVSNLIETKELEALIG
jgi:hypothetical protein